MAVQSRAVASKPRVDACQSYVHKNLSAGDVNN